MKQLLVQFWVEEEGFVVSAELVLLLTLLLIGMLVGLQSLRDSTVAEAADVAAAIGTLNQSYSYGGLVGHSSIVFGSFYRDQTDFCDEVQGDVQQGEFPQCISAIQAQDENTTDFDSFIPISAIND